MEFKGNKGKWKRVSVKNNAFLSARTNEIQYGEDGECVAEYVFNDYDAQLISKAPELLEALEMQIDSLDLSNLDFYNKYSFNVSELTEKQRLLIIEATTI